MPAPFASLSQVLSQAVDGRFGELLRFIPKGTSDNWGNGIDGGRPIVECVGTLIIGADDISFTDGDRHQSSFNGRASTQDIRGSVDRSFFLDGQAPRKGDHVEALDQMPVRIFEIVDVYPDGYARWMFPLVKASP